MPAATTHIEFVKDVYRLTPEIRNKITNMHMFYLGSQGPDLLFFSNMSVLPYSLHKYGNLMHENKVYEVIKYFEEYSQNDDDLMSYLYGYLCHYALDTTVHPLVYALTQERVNNGEGHPGVIHVSMESEIDVYVLHQRGRHTYQYDAYNYLIVDKECITKLSTMYHKMFKEIFDLDISIPRIKRSINEVYIWTKWIRPRKVTHDLIYAGETLANNTHGLTAMMLYDTIPGKIINLDHTTYTTPWNTTINNSLPELYGKALTLAEKLLIDGYTSLDFLNDFKGEPLKKVSSR